MDTARTFVEKEDAEEDDGAECYISPHGVGYILLLWGPVRSQRGR